MTWIISTGRYDGQSLDSLRLEPEFRRATSNMLMSYLAVKECLDSAKISWAEVRDRMGLVVATSHGELSSTVGFLKELAVSKTARPLLFQGSLHNATLGFLSKAFSITGPGITVCDCYRSGEEALGLAETLLVSTLDYCLVVGVDGKSPEIETPLALMYPNGTSPGEGAGALLLTNESGKKCVPARARLNEVVEAVQRAPESEKPFLYDSCTIEVLGNFLEKTL